MVPGPHVVAPFAPGRVAAPLVLALVLGFLPTVPAAAASTAVAVAPSTAAAFTPSTAAVTPAAGAATTGSGSAAKAQTQCFESISGPPTRRDLEQLRLVIEGRRVLGEYHWIPWGKDRRSGRLEGNLSSPGKAQVLYRFMQEGQWGSAPLTIQFSGQQARISWDPIRTRDPSAAPLPPPVLLPHRACSALKSIPGL